MRAQRTQILGAMAQIVSDQTPESATVAPAIARSGCFASFYDLFEDRNVWLDAVLEEGVTRGLERTRATYDPQARWVNRLRAGLYAVSELIDEQPELARLCVAHALANPATFNGRRKTLDQLTRLIDEGRGETRKARQPPPLAARGVLGGVLGLIYARVIARDSRSFLELLIPLMSIIVLPYLGAAAAERELARPTPAHPPRLRKHTPVRRSGGPLP